MGETGICWDNSPAESFWSTFKHEHCYRHVYATKTELVAAIGKWIRFCRSVRRHSAVGMLSPRQLRAVTPNGCRNPSQAPVRRSG
ncbi:integrase core domain-containing protein [Amycolatopsis nivea]